MHKIKMVLGLAVIAGLLVSTSPLLAQGQGKGKKGKPTEEQQSEQKGQVSEVQGQKGKPGQPGRGQLEKGKPDEEPPAGWGKGKKEGWESDVPPGWENWDEASKSKWQEDVKQAKEKMRARSKKGKKLSKAKMDSACVALEEGAKAGIPVEEVNRVVEKGLDRGLHGSEIQAATRAMARGARQGIETAPMADFVQQKLDEGLRGDALSTQIEAEIDRRHTDKVRADAAAQEEMERQKAAQAKKWWQFWK